MGCLVTCIKNNLKALPQPLSVSGRGRHAPGWLRSRGRSPTAQSPAWDLEPQQGSGTHTRIWNPARDLERCFCPLPFLVQGQQRLSGTASSGPSLSLAGCFNLVRGPLCKLRHHCMLCSSTLSYAATFLPGPTVIKRISTHTAFYFLIL